MKNKLKENLRQGKAIFGTMITTACVDIAEIIAHTGVDFIMIDCEHGSIGIETAGRMTSIIRNLNVTPFIRVACNEMAPVQSSLNTGVYGVMIPNISTKEDAIKAVQFCKYPPVGNRGVGPNRAVLYGTGADEFADYHSTANDEILVIAQIEHYVAVENIDEILSVPGIDIAFIGQRDLCMSMGIPGQIDHPDIEKSCIKVIEACKKYDIIPGIVTSDGNMEKHLKMGFKFLQCGTDSLFLYNGIKQAVNEFKSY
jgi:2-keto-3-deoxy-L-rhamnonate aldolase RhmA